MQTIRFDGRSLGRAPEGSRRITFRASTPAVDRHGTIIRPEGIKTEKFDRNPIFLFGHDGYGSMFGGGPNIDSVIGKVVSHRKSQEAFDIDVEFAGPDVNPKADMAFRMVDAGFLNAVSIGFMPIKVHEEEISGRGMTEVFDEVELLEVSLVPIPSNPEALSLVRQIAGAAERIIFTKGGTFDARLLADEVTRLAKHMYGRTITDFQLESADVLLRIGKVLSSANEQRIRHAVEELQNVLSTLKKVEEESEQTEEIPTPPAKAADPGAVTAALKAAFQGAQLPSAIATAIQKGFKR